MGLTITSCKKIEYQRSNHWWLQDQMTDISQPHLEADTLTVDSLKPKQKTRITCWNVRTLYQTDKLPQAVREFHTTVSTFFVRV